MPTLLQRLCWAALLALVVTPAWAADPDPAVKKTFEKLVAAIQTGDREAFTEDGTQAVKTQTSQDVMNFLRDRIGGRLKQGFDAKYLCELKQADHQIYLWKVGFKDEGDDVIMRLVEKDGKVAGFYLQ